MLEIAIIIIEYINPNRVNISLYLLKNLNFYLFTYI